MKHALIEYTLHLADNALILGHRNSEWCGHGPVLEQDIAITNISLDLVGQARNFYQYAASLINESSSDQTITEDTLAYERDDVDFKNCLLAEQPRGDWAQTILRQFLFSAYQYSLYEKLQESKDEQLAAISTKSLKEVTYHLRWSSEWVIRLGDGTDESRERLLAALDHLWNYTDELFEPQDYELHCAEDGIGTVISLLKENWIKKVTDIFTQATITIPKTTMIQKGGKQGNHTKHLRELLADMQTLQRTYPGCEW